ncbi:cyclophilin-like protein [Sistotremastrum niveocremeum HHB9708]|uniref:Cyclophilin-like protein n=1 Tax=Sistotremastrum niveocremeum HHB9708 TaxID=1314777 RepID=A0A164VWE3_9AGAM|nr:cyclophilin-like protein [Sistotremastrum niveocremeum HHB9708]
MALPTRGRVLLDTTAGDIEIELWSKEAPKACRNFIALALEGYYDGVIFHRVVPGFLVQTGDRTGTGGGGESFFGEPFEDEIHPRLRFSHRGIVAMANNGTKDSNDSQFIITLDRADELHGKHTLFGRVVGDTIYNVLKIGNTELGANERPVYPPKINTVRILDNPFDDIIPRITAEEKRVQQAAREQAQKEREAEARRSKGKKNVKLLSFGEEEGAAEEEVASFKKKSISRPDLVDVSDQIPVPLARATTPVKRREKTPTVELPVEGKSKKRKEDQDDLAAIRRQHEESKDSAESKRKAEIEKMEAEIRKLSKRRGEGSDDDDAPKKKQKGPSLLEQELAKYKSNQKGRKAGKRKDEGDVLAMMNSFRGKLKANNVPEEEDNANREDGENEDGLVPEPEEGMEVDDDVGWLSHALHFPKDNNETETQKAEHEYEVIDPRVRANRAKEEARERKARQQAKQGHSRGYRH